MVESFPQYSVKELYRGVPKKRKVYNPDGTFVVIEELPNEPIITGIKVFDDFITELSNGNGKAEKFCEELGVPQVYFSGLIYMLTGLNMSDFKLEYKKCIVEDYFTYCLPSYNVMDLAAKLGCTSHHLEYLCKKWYNLSARAARIYFEEKNDKKNIFIE